MGRLLRLSQRRDRNVLRWSVVDRREGTTMRSGMEIIVPGHRRWPEFLSRLSRARLCSGNTEHARQSLIGMGEVDVEGTLRELARLGGTCDCQIELDVASPFARLGA